MLCTTLPALCIHSASQHCITNHIDLEMTGRTSTKVTQFLIQRQIFDTLATHTAFRAKHHSITYLLDVKIDLLNTSKKIARVFIKRQTIDHVQRQHNDYSKTCRIHCAISHSAFHHTQRAIESSCLFIQEVSVFLFAI